MDITKGTWEVKKGSESFYVKTPDRMIAKLSGLHTDEAKDNANLIAEAGTVANETGFTPRQLAEQKADLLAACEEAVGQIQTLTDEHINGINYHEKQDAAIAKATEQMISVRIWWRKERNCYYGEYWLHGKRHAKAFRTKRDANLWKSYMSHKLNYEAWQGVTGQVVCQKREDLQEVLDKALDGA